MIKFNHSDSPLLSYRGLAHGLPIGCLRGFICLSLLLSSSFAWARPAVRTVSQIEGDATLTLTLESQYIEGDSNVPCEVSVTILDENRAFTEGDTIDLYIREDDPIGDDTFWEVHETVSAAIVAAGVFERTYDCRFPAMGDAFGGLEIFAKLEVNKQECGGFCEATGGEDRPSTANIYMNRTQDDAAEDDDSSRLGTLVEQRLISDRIAIDADWFELSYEYPIELLARLETHLIGGDLDLKLYNQSLDLIATASAEPDGEAKSLRPPSGLNAGTYFLEVTPRVEGDYNFYDLHIVESQVMGDCIAGNVESRPCGLCGQEERICNGGGEWGVWSACLGSGECQPGAEESEGCGEGGNRNRLCTEECVWGSFGSCIQCEEGAVESCYTGPAELAGIGACAEGMKSCSRGQWSSCQGDQLPRAEVCGDGEDNDCNGQVDDQDEACAGGIGEACSSSSCAADLECLPYPGGYCGGASCSACPSGSVCGEVWGQERCLAPCGSVNDCRSGYLCAPAGLGGQSLCVPPCRGDQDCGSGESCSSSGLCDTAMINEEASLGAACSVSDDCASPWACLTGVFPSGYCGGNGCGLCGTDAVCGQVRGQDFCLAPCASAGDCRQGYLCAPAGTSGELACLPACSSDMDCTFGQTCSAQGSCENAQISPELCAGVSCSQGERCGMDPSDQMERCLPTCSSDDMCSDGLICGVEGLCTAASSVVVRKAPEEGCQQSPSRHEPLFFYFMMIGILIRKVSFRKALSL